MRIGFITYEYPPDTGKGGIGTYTKQIALLLAGEGIEVHVFAGSHDREVTEELTGIFIHRILCESPHDFRSKVVPVFCSVHRRFPFDVIESAEIHANASEVKKALPSIPLIVRLHAPDYVVESLKKRYVPFLHKLRFLLGALKRGYWDAGYWRKYEYINDRDYLFTSMADAITAPSTAMKDWAVQNWKINPNKISVISNPFEPDDALLNLPLVNALNHKTIVYFGRLNVLKGLVNATKAISKILQRHPDWKFKVIGDDGPGPVPGGLSMRAWMQKQLQQFKNRVFFYDGFTYEELPYLLKEGEIIILPSLFESFSYTCIEAMAAGKAIVGSSNGGMKDLIENGKTGILVNPDDADEIYDAINVLITKPLVSFAMAEQARGQIKTTKRNEMVLNQTVVLYRSLSNG